MADAKKLYPPVIEGTLPAFYGDTITVPFSMNRAVSNYEVGGFNIQIKNVNNNSYIYSGSISFNGGVDEIPASISFPVPDNLFIIGQHYKVQIAYRDKIGTVGYYSTVGVVKYTTEPEVTIDGLDVVTANQHIYTYTGLYSQLGGDTTEKVYKYKFNLYDNNKQLVKTSDWKLHNSSYDDKSYESTDVYQLDEDLIINKVYYINYQVETTNKMIKSSPQYKITQSSSIDAELKADLVPQLNYQNGYVELLLKGKIDPTTNLEYAVTGAFKLVRAEDTDDYVTWNELLKFSLYGQQPTRSLWKDFTVKQGVNYRYALQQYNDKNLVSNKLESTNIYVDFEDAFLYDGERQLKIKFNPKVSSFKNTLLESKTDTIGNKYPFIFRNGNVKYKEFPISGLISYHADEEFLFYNQQLEFPITDLLGENINAERNFKLEVLEWLTNGEPKIFRSPSEGNYVVRLMNVSLSPNDTVGRMLHTFSATAYEIDDFNYDALLKYGMVQTADPTVKQLRWETIDLKTFALDNEVPENLLNYVAVGLQIDNATPGDKVYIDDSIARGDIEIAGRNYTTGYIAEIGKTGSYYIDLSLGVEIKKLNFVSLMEQSMQGYQSLLVNQAIITYAYYSKLVNQFDLISSIMSVDVALQQFIGNHDILNEINDTKNEIQRFNYFSCRVRDTQIIYTLNDKYYLSVNNALDNVNAIELDDPYLIYAVYYTTQSEQLDELGIPYMVYDFKNYIDGYNGNEYSKEHLNNSKWISLNGNRNIDLSTTLVYTTYNMPTITTLAIGDALMAEVSYQKQIKEFSLEESNEDVAHIKSEYENMERLLYNAIYTSEDFTDTLIEDEWIEAREQDIAEKREDRDIMYNNFIDILNQEIERRKEMQGEPV